MKTVFKELLPRAVTLLLIFTLLCGLLYSFAVTGLAQLIFPSESNGSIITVDGKQYGSELLGQQFTGETHLWGRVMKLDTVTYTNEAGEPVLYAAPMNLSPASPEYAELVSQRVELIRAAHPERGDAPIPVDLVTVSGSGLDPNISAAAAEYQVERLARSTGRTPDEVRAVIAKHTTGKLWGILGEPVVNVLKVNLELDGILA